MKYTTLKQDIASILTATDLGLHLKMYDDKGNTTIEPDDAAWVYVFDNNIMIELMSDDNPVISFWKSPETLNDDFKGVIQRIRELAILNGVSVQIRVYDNLNQRKIYNLIKSTMENKEDEMNESVNSYDKSLVEAFTKMIGTAKSSEKASDFFLSEELKSVKTSNLLKEMYNELSSLSGTKQLSELFNRLMTARTKTDVETILGSVPEEVKKGLIENVENINNVSTFVKQRYENNIELGKSSTNNLLILENVKVYRVKVKNNHKNLSEAYNKLLEVSDGITDNLKLLQAIKANKICETYNVSRKQLLDYYICGNNEPVQDRYAIVIEDAQGEKTAFNDKLKSGIKALANYFNNGGSKDSQICKNIVSEIVKYNDIRDFVLEYKDSYSMRRYVPRFKKIFKECVRRLNEASKNYSRELFENVESTLPYDRQLEELQEAFGIKHPALKYLAIKLATADYNKSKMIFEQEEKDMTVLVDELCHYSDVASSIASYIIENGLGLKTPLSENVSDNIISVSSMLYESLADRTDKVGQTVASSLFNIVHTNRYLIESKRKYIETLIKYLK